MNRPGPQQASPSPPARTNDSAPAVAAARGPEVAAALTRNLAVFGATSVAAGSALALTRRSATVVAFGQQSAMWGAINLAIAGVGHWRSRSHPAQAGPLRRTLLINAGLDVGYVAAGAHLAYHRSSLGGRLSPEDALGHGLAVVVQGIGLMQLDLLYARRLSA